jgi:hypothetical protein
MFSAQCKADDAKSLPTEILWVADSLAGGAKVSLSSSSEGVFVASRYYSLPSTYHPEGDYVGPARWVWDDNLGYWDESHKVDVGGDYTNSARAGKWPTEAAYYLDNPPNYDENGEIIDPAIYCPILVATPVWVPAPGYRLLGDETPRQFYAFESVIVCISTNSTGVGIRRNLSVFEKMLDGMDYEVSVKSTDETANIDWDSGLLSTPEFELIFPAPVEVIFPHMFVLDSSIFAPDLQAGSKNVTTVSFVYHPSTDVIDSLSITKMTGDTTFTIGTWLFGDWTLNIPGGGDGGSAQVTSLGGGYANINFHGDVYSQAVPLNWISFATDYEMDIKWNLDVLAYVNQSIPSGYVSGYHTSYPTFTLTYQNGLIYQSRQTSIWDLLSPVGQPVTSSDSAINVNGTSF